MTVVVEPYRVDLEVFEGPLDLLLTLIRRESLQITEVALAKVTAGYLRYLEKLEVIDVSGLADFCDTAATLMLIKSRALLPRPPEDDLDEEGDAQELVERLKAYRHFKRTAERLGERQSGGIRAYARVAPTEAAPPARGEIEPSDLATAFQDALAEAEREALEEVQEQPDLLPQRVRLIDRFNGIRDVLLQKKRITFREVILGGRPKGAEPREFVIVSFLALLELLRRFAVAVRQDDLFGEIEIEALASLSTVRAPGEEGSFMEDL